MGDDEEFVKKALYKIIGGLCYMIGRPNHNNKIQIMLPLGFFDAVDDNIVIDFDTVGMSQFIKLQVQLKERRHE